MRTLAIGDIHNRANGLIQVLQRANFDYDNDKLILLGDLIDGADKAFETIEELLKIKNCVFVLGNHDKFLRDYIKYGQIEDIHWYQGGEKTFESYQKNGGIPDSHKQFFNEAVTYHMEENMIFLHGGYKLEKGFEKNTVEDIAWDRSLYKEAMLHNIDEFDKIFIGHTQTAMLCGKPLPLKFHNLIMLDTNAGFDGRLTVMDIYTEEYWQSDDLEMIEVSHYWG